MYDASKPDLRALEAEAYQQSGYFTAAQARSHAVTRQLLSHHIRQGRFTHLRRGLSRVQGFPTSENDDLRERWMAVGADKAILSHESALALLDLSDNIPAAVHVLVSRRHRGLRRLRRHRSHPPRQRDDRHRLARRPATDHAGANPDRRRRRDPTRAGIDGCRPGAAPRSRHRTRADGRGRASTQAARPCRRPGCRAVRDATPSTRARQQ